jgi:hypothetical protein
VLTNGTGKALQDVYLAFKSPMRTERGDYTDWLLYLKSWQPGVSINLGQEFSKSDQGQAPASPGGDGWDRAARVKGTLDLWQAQAWNGALERFASVSGDGAMDNVPQSFVLMSLFDRLATIPNEQLDDPKRVELLRRGARHLDRSSAIAAGALVVVAHSEGAMPVPLEVEGDKITGDGPIFYQFVLPLDRMSVDAQLATTEPSGGN